MGGMLLLDAHPGDHKSSNYEMNIWGYATKANAGI